MVAFKSMSNYINFSLEHLAPSVNVSWRGGACRLTHLHLAPPAHAGNIFRGSSVRVSEDRKLTSWSDDNGTPGL